MRKTTAILLFWMTLGGVLIADQDPAAVSLPVSLQDSVISIRFPYCDFITPQDSTSLIVGEEIACVCRLELWQKRKMWFDHLRETVIHYFTLSYDRWDERFVLFYHDSDGWEVTERFALLDSLCEYLGRRLPLNLPLEREDFYRESYLAYAFSIDYLTLEQLGEIREWLSSGGDRHGKSNSLPDKIVGFLLKSSGLKNRSDLRTSEHFYPSSLKGDIKF